MSEPGSLHLLDATIVAALIAATLSLLNLLTSKEQKTSEFRQSWIDGLRSDIADVIASMHQINQFYVLPQEVITQQFAVLAGALQAANVALARVRLRLNPDEPESAELLALLEKIECRVDKIGGEPDITIMNEFERDLLRISAIILKREWERVKRGEPVFFIAKWVALAISIVTCCVLIGKEASN